jgi:hypothetical protein
MKFSWLRRIAFLVVLCSTPVAEHLSAQASNTQCGGLHVGLMAFSSKLFDRESTSSVTFEFLLVNDGNDDVDVRPDTWKIVVDGQPLNDLADPIFLNDRGQPLAFAPLKPGEFRYFTLTLDPKYFDEARTYRISWEGKGFRSATISLTPELARKV